jgi:drug/metabolite transporter (DMT)-like permease
MNAVLLAFIGFFLFTLMDLSIKWLLQSYSLAQVTFFNCVFALIGLLIWIFPKFESLKTSRPKVHLIRAVIILVIDLLAFYSYSKVTLAEAYALLLTLPLFTMLFSVMLKHERFDIRRMILSFTGFLGILLVLAPGYATFEVALLGALASSVIEALGFLMIKHYNDTETPQAFAFYGFLLLTLVTGVVTIFEFQPMTTMDVSISIGGGLCYAAATAFVVSAFHTGQPSMVSNMQYTQLIWGLLLAFIIWNELPSVSAAIGGVIIVLAGLRVISLKPVLNE